MLNSPRFHCIVVNSTATILTAFGGQCIAPPVGLSLHITSITASASVISSTTADNYPSVKYGTGGTCGTGTTTAWSAFTLALDAKHADFPTAIKIPALNELCWMHAAAGNKTFIVTGYLAP
jgi:hypothetical protein